MPTIWDTLLGDKMPPHGHCYLWNEDLVNLHVGSDVVIAASYFTIPIALAYLVLKRDDLHFNYMFVLFGVFIFACGLTHVMNIYNVWYGAYWLSGLVKVVTALASLGTAILVWPLIPKALAIPSNETLRQLNLKLQEGSNLNYRQRLEMEKLSEQLAVLVETRTQEVTELTRVRAELEVKNLELASSNDALQQFTYIASHDLKEPLRTINSMGALLKQTLGGKLEDSAAQMLDFIVGSAQRMTTLVEDLRSYTVVGNLNEKFSQTDLDTTVDTILQDLSMRISDLGTQVEIQPLGKAEVIAPQFQQLMQNLLSNAIKFSAGSQPPVVSVGKFDTGKAGELGIYVRDNGIGIDAAYRDKIFGVFQRLHSRDEYEGTGIGLAICKKIIDRHNGRIEVVDAPEQGTEFRVIIPANERS